ncbi:MAG: SET domain-containing protein [Thiogranum sp.]
MSILNPAIKVKKDSVIEGAGLVTDRFLPAGEILFKFDDTKPPAHHYEMVDWPPQRRIRFLAFAIQIGKDDFSFRQGDIKYINHSCDPTGWWLNYGILTARRDIQPGEEITYDYSTADITLTYRMECLCGTDACRGVVTNMDYLNPDFQKKYADHLPEHVVDAISEAQSGDTDSRKYPVDQIPDHVIDAVRQAKLKAPELRTKFGNQYIFEMVRQAIQQAKSGDPEFHRKHGDKYLFDMIRELVLKR